LADREFELLRTQDDFVGQPERATANGTPILFPFPNRIREGRFQWGGKQYEIPRNERGINAIHGLVFDRRWRAAIPDPALPTVTGHFHLSRDAAALSSFWPADFVIEVTYSLDRNRLTSRLRITNPDSRPLPWGFGTHPYLRFPLAQPGNSSACAVFAPASERWELQDLLPTGRRLPLGNTEGLDGRRPYSELAFDDVFTSLEFIDNWCTCRLVDRHAGVASIFRFDRLFRDLVIYTPPDRSAICLEPYTCITDAINLQPRGVDAGLQVLAPGMTVEGTISLGLEPLSD
jgi:aldose 1-epimerase